MNYFDELCVKNLTIKCQEIENDNNMNLISQTVDAYERVISFAEVSRSEGLLALEDASEQLNMNDEPQALFFEMIQLVVDGTEPSIVEHIGMNRCITMNLPSYQGIMNLMYVQGSLMIQAGETPWIIGKMLKSMMPKPVIDELIRRDCENDLPKDLAEVESKQSIVEDFCEDDKEIDEKDHSIVSETAKALIVLSDKDIQRLIRDINNSTLAMAMKGLPGKARARILNNMSKRLAVMLSKDMMYMGPVPLKYVEEECVTLAKTLLKLADSCEINEYDFSILKVVIDMFDSAEKENQILREKYKELRSIINKIYND